MGIRLHCDGPGCDRSIPVDLSEGRIDLRSTEWWIVTGTGGSICGCCVAHLNTAAGVSGRKFLTPTTLNSYAIPMPPALNP